MMEIRPMKEIRMKRLLVTIPLLFTLLALAACEKSPSGEDAGTKAKSSVDVARSIDSNRLRAHMEFLASDEMQGREAGSRNYDIAANYVAAQYQLMGLQPAGGDGSYMQPIRMRSTTLDIDSQRMTLEIEGKAQDLEAGEDFTLFSNAGMSEHRSAGDLVFVGYGVRATDFGYDDYADIDADGKIVVMFTGAPDSLPNNERAHYSSSSLKQQTAVEQGAIGAIYLVHPKDAERYKWERIKRWNRGTSMDWIAPDGSVPEAFPELRVRGMLHSDVAKKLLASAELDFETAAETLREGKPMSRPIPATVEMSARSEHEEIVTANVVGKLPGSDPELRNEYVVYTAHLDGQGMKEPSTEEEKAAAAEKGEPIEEPEDLIKNSAYDNALGVAIMLEAARAMTALPEAPKRSVLFVALAAEEKGLLGSEYFAKFPPVAETSNLVANVNIDMPILTFEQSDVLAFGAENSTLGEIASREVAKVGVSIAPDPAPEERFFVRSDQYSFVKEGIPAIAIDAGRTAKDPNVDGNALTEEFLDTHYHKASDEPGLPYAADTAERFAAANMLVGLAIANAAERPQWNAGDFFGRTFGPDRMATEEQ